MNKLQVELGKHVGRIKRVTKRKYPEADEVTVSIRFDGRTQVCVWKDRDIICSNFELSGTTKQVIQKINAGALTE